MVEDQCWLKHRIEHGPYWMLWEMQYKAVDVFVAGELATQAIADSFRIHSLNAMGMASKASVPGSVPQTAAGKQHAIDNGISRRMEALNEHWLKRREAVNQRKAPRADQIYALMARTKRQLENQVRR
jgi:hypothetical protein